MAGVEEVEDMKTMIGIEVMTGMEDITEMVDMDNDVRKDR